jgi:hypothetical protein
MKANLTIFISILLSALIAIAVYNRLNSFSFEEETKSYHIKAAFPYSTNSYVEKTLKELINDEINNFKEDFKEPSPSGNWKNELYISSDKYKAPGDIESYLLNIYTFTGGAHGGTNIVSKNFDKSKQCEIELSSVFQEDSNYLEVISQKSIKELMKRLVQDDIPADSKQLREDWIKEGAAPKEENYRVFTFTPKEIVFHFGQYQVASYADGIQKVKIPLSEISDLLKPPFTKSKNQDIVIEASQRDVPTTKQNCIWDKFESRKLGIEVPIQACSWGDLSPEFYEVDNSIVQMPSKLKNPRKFGSPIIKVFYKKQDEDIKEEIEKEFINKLPKSQKKHCLVNESIFILNDPNKQTFVIEPDEFLQWKIDNDTPNNQAPPDPCGDFGISGTGSVKYFEYHPGESTTKYVFVIIGQDTLLFDEKMIGFVK